MPRKGKRSQARAQGQRAIQRREPIWMAPPTVQTGTIVRQTYRFRNTSVNTVGLSVGMLLRACGLVALANAAAGAGQLAPIACSARLRRLRLWGAVNGLGNTTQVSTAIATVSADFDVDINNGGNPGLQFTDTTMSPTRLAFLDVVPPARSFASFWHSQVEAAEVLVNLNCALSTIMDLEVEWVLNDDDGIAGLGLTQNTIAQTVGHTYTPNLGLAGNWVPQGRIANGNA